MKKVLLLLISSGLLMGAIFYFVTAKIVEDKNITVKLPPTPSALDALDSGGELNPRNVLNIKVDSLGRAIMRGEVIKIKDIRTFVRDFISNPDKDKTLAISPKHAIISLGNDRNAPYDKYLKIYNEIKGAYIDLWDTEALKKHSKTYEELNRQEKKEIRKDIPLVLSEAEPTGFE